MRPSGVASAGARLVGHLPVGVRRLAVGSGIARRLQLELRLRALEEAIDENAALEVGLERRVAALEAALLPALRARQR